MFLGDDMDEYFTELGQATGKGFTLISQSIVSMRQGPHVTYLMKKVRFIVVGWNVGGRAQAAQGGQYLWEVSLSWGNFKGQENI